MAPLLAVAVVTVCDGVVGVNRIAPLLTVVTLCVSVVAEPFKGTAAESSRDGRLRDGLIRVTAWHRC
jgi:hypothetical protein